MVCKTCPTESGDVSKLELGVWGFIVFIGLWLLGFGVQGFKV